MTLGKKIGGGFCVILILTLIQGVMSYRTMDEGAETSQVIASDRVPRLVHYSVLQNELLQAAYYARAYFATRDESQYGIATSHLELMKKEMVSLRELNKAHFFQTTANFLDNFDKEIAEYESQVTNGKTLIANIQKAYDNMLKSGAETEEDIHKLISTMTETLREFAQAGNVSAVVQYSRNISDAVNVLSRVSNVLEDLLTAERNNKPEEFARQQQLLPAIARDFRAIQDNLLRKECKDLCQATLQTYERFSKAAEEVAQDSAINLTANRNRIELFNRMLTESDGIVDTTSENTINLVRDAANKLSSGTNIVMIIVAIVMIIGIIVAIIITRMIVKPLTTTQRFAEGVAAGNLEHELTVRASDETGKLADALRSMVAALKTNISEAHQKSEQAQKATEEAQQAMQKAEEAAKRAESAKRDGMLAAAGQLEGMVEIISSASTQLSAQIEQSDRGASESAQRLQEAATAMNEMNATVQEVARNAGSASTASADTKHKAEAGEHVVHQVVQSIGEVQQVSLQLKADMAQLNERAQDINRIMGVISDIADQTNLLALNAAIEAARAGEAGRGFAVVADEVRKLAEKTMTSTLDVSNAIRAIQESTDKSMSAVDNAVMRISEATELANQSGAALEEIVATVEATSDQVQAIAAASEEQSAASEEINRSIIEVNDMSRLTAEAMAEANQAVSDLANQAHKLTDLIQQMKNSQ